MYVQGVPDFRSSALTKLSRVTDQLLLLFFFFYVVLKLMMK